MNANPTPFFFFFKSTPCCVPKGGVSPLLRSKQPWSPAAGGGQHSPGCSSSSPELLMPSPPASTQQPAQGGVGQDTLQDVELHLISLLVSRSKTGVKQPERGSAARSRTIHTSPSSQLTKSQADAAAKVSQRVQVFPLGELPRHSFSLGTGRRFASVHVLVPGIRPRVLCKYRQIRQGMFLLHVELLGQTKRAIREGSSGVRMYESIRGFSAGQSWPQGCSQSWPEPRSSQLTKRVKEEVLKPKIAQFKLYLPLATAPSTQASMQIARISATPSESEKIQMLEWI